jgi:thymidylate synthase (FAD)
MKIQKACFKIEDAFAGDQILKNIEKYGRTCYKSEDKITDESAKKFVKTLIDKGHLSVLEHEKITVRIICDRGVSHEIVRHRIGSYSQESTRYCNYSGEVKYIQPDFILSNDDLLLLETIENHYKKRIDEGLKPQQARYFLPNGLKTEIVCTFNLREWRLVLKQRTSPSAHPQMREIMILLLSELKKQIPVIFDDI